MSKRFRLRTWNDQCTNLRETGFQGQRKHSMDACAMCSRTMGIKLFDFFYHRAMLYFNFCI